jgi:hypothetical protein
MSEKRQKYRQLCQNANNIPLYSQDWWLDLVCGSDNWNVSLVEKDQEILAAMPYHQASKWGFSLINLPPLTQALSVWTNEEYLKNIPGVEKQSKAVDNLYDRIIQDLPEFDKFAHSIHHSAPTPSQFIKRGFAEIPRVTQVIEDVSDLDAVYMQFKRYIKRNIKKAESQVEVIESYDMEKFFAVHRQIFDHQKIKLPYDSSFLEKLVQEGKKRDACKCLFAVDPQGNLHSGLLAVRDHDTLYMLVGSSDTKMRKSGADYLLYWEFIKYAHENNLQFDFEGSMLPNINRRNKDFGAVEKHFPLLIKVNSKILSIYSTYNSIVQKGRRLISKVSGF